MSAACSYADLEHLQSLVSRNTVDRLKSIISGFATECHISINRYGKKAELIDRICKTLAGWEVRGDLASFNMARGIIYQVMDTGSYVGCLPMCLPSRPPGDLIRPYLVVPAVSVPTTARPSASDASSTTLHVPAASALRPGNEQPVSPFVECPEATANHKKRETMLFTLSDDHIVKLRSTTEPWQLRLYCTSNSFCGAGAGDAAYCDTTCPTEFPPACDIRVNDIPLSASTNGLRNKPGTAPPPNLGDSVDLRPGASNKVDLIYAYGQGSKHKAHTDLKMYYFVVMLVRFIDPAQLVDRLKKDNYVSADRVREHIRLRRSSEDDDIVVSQSTISLRCPLSHTRLVTPARSGKCMHASCFDALAWFSVNEQTSTWSCPICDIPISQDELIVDGYIDEILNATHEDAEDVIVEADGEWHTAGDEYGSHAWRSARVPHPASPPNPMPLVTSTIASGHLSASSGLPSGRNGDKDKAPDVEAPVSDPNQAQSSRSGASLTSPAIIDLTLSDDDGSIPDNIMLPSIRKRPAADEASISTGKRARVRDTAGVDALLGRSCSAVCD